MMSKELMPIRTSQYKAAIPMKLVMIGRAKEKNHPYIAIFSGSDHSWIEDKDIRRLRNWCNEILESRKP